MPPNNDSLVGRYVADRYRVLHKIGEGGMGDVYAAEDAQHSRLVALKVMRRDVDDPAVALAGSDVPDALERVASTDALETARGYALEQYAGTYNLYRGASGAVGTCNAGTCPGVLAANSVFGGLVVGVPTPSKNPPDVTVAGTINLQTTACQQPTGSIF